MPTYQCAYPLERLRSFAKWNEKPLAGAEGPLTNDATVFVQEDLTVTTDCFDKTKVLFDDVTPEWEAFCKTELGFAVPDWEQESIEVRKQLAEMGAIS